MCVFEGQWGNLGLDGPQACLGKPPKPPSHTPSLFSFVALLLPPSARAFEVVVGLHVPLHSKSAPSGGVRVQEEEQRRIVGAGGFVAMNRVNGSLAVSRALGDYDFKRHPTLAAGMQQVSAEPTCTGATVCARRVGVLVSTTGVNRVYCLAVRGKPPPGRGGVVLSWSSKRCVW